MPQCPYVCIIHRRFRRVKDESRVCRDSARPLHRDMRNRGISETESSCFLLWTETGPIKNVCLHRIKQMNPNGSFCEVAMAEQKIKQDISIGANIRELRKARGLKQTDLVGLLQLEGVPMTREALVKIERGAQHIQASQLRAIRDALQTTYDELLKPS